MERRPSREEVIGRQVGRYMITSHLASGGMSELYIARQEAVGGFEKNLVIKVLQDRYAQHPRVVRMFLDEARLAAKLNHPSIVHVYDVAEEDGNKFIAMEYIQGETLTDIIKRGVEVGAFLPLEHALHIVSQVAAGLDYAHRRHEPGGALLRIVHRDVSPSNIMVSYEGQTKIIDFGIARVQDQIGEESGMHPGKASYMSPEQVAGAAIDYRSDIFSLGIILFEITVAQRLWRGPAEEVKRRIVTETIPPPTSIRRDYPPALELVVMRALEKRPEDRYQSAEELRQDLEELVTAAGYRSGARRVALYMREMFPIKASLSDEGAVQPRPPGNGDSIPLPVATGSGPISAPIAGSLASPGARAASPGARAASPGSAPGGAPASGPIQPTVGEARAPAPTLVVSASTGTPSAAIPGSSSPSRTSARMSAVPATTLSVAALSEIPNPRGPSNAKLAVIAATVTFALVTAVVLLGRSRHPEVRPPAEASEPPPAAGHGAAVAPVATAEAPVGLAANQPRSGLGYVREGTSTASRPTASPHPAGHLVPAALPSSHGLTFTNDRARNRRQRRQVSAAESPGRSSPPSPAEPAPAPSTTPPASAEPQRPPPGEPTSIRHEVRPATAAAHAAAATQPTQPPDEEAVSAPAALGPRPGFVDSKAVTAVIRAHAAEVQGCFDRALMDRADLRGRLTVRATIDPSGHVLAVSPTSVMEGGGRLQTCIVAAFERWVFPPPTGGVKGTINYSFSFD